MNALLRREVWAHAWLVGPCAAAPLAVLVLAVALGAFPRLGELAREGAPWVPVAEQPLAVFRAYVLLGLLPLAALLVHRLFVREYAARGWEVLERLPLTQARVVQAKLALALALLGALLVGAWLLAFALPGALPGAEAPLRREALARAALQGGAGLLGLGFAYLFATATLGRHRLLGHAGALALLVGLSLAGRSPEALPGLAFLGQAPDATRVPGRDDALLLAGALLALGLTLATLRRGALARAWQGPLAARDLTRAGALALAVAAAAQLRAGPPRPLELDAPESLARARGELGGVALVRAPSAQARPRAEALALALARDLDLLAELGLAPPPLAVEASEGALPGPPEQANLRGRREVLLRAAVAHPDLDREELRAAALRAALDAATDARLRRGVPRLLREGLPEVRVHAGLPAAHPARVRCAARAEVALAALAARAGDDLPPPEELAARFEALPATLGDELARALGCALLERYEERTTGALIGRAYLVVAEALRGGDPAGGAEHLEALGAPRLSALLRELLAGGGRARPALPRLRALEIDAEAGALRLRAEVEGAARLSLVHALAAPGPRWDPRLDPAEERVASGARITSARRYPPGARVRVAVEVDLPGLGCALRLASRELRLP